MIHHHSSGKRRLWKRIFSMCIALILICGMTVPASSVSASSITDGVSEEVETTDGKTALNETASGETETVSGTTEMEASESKTDDSATQPDETTPEGTDGSETDNSETNDSETNDSGETAPTATVTYTFYVDGEVYNTQTLKDGETLTAPADPEADGKIFDGWYTAETDGEKFTAFGVQTVTETKTVDLYAGWLTDAESESDDTPESAEETPGEEAGTPGDGTGSINTAEDEGGTADNMAEEPGDANDDISMMANGTETIQVGKTITLNGEWGWSHEWSKKGSSIEFVGSTNSDSVSIKGISTGNTIVTHTYWNILGQKRQETFNITVTEALEPDTYNLYAYTLIPGVAEGSSSNADNVWNGMGVGRISGVYSPTDLPVDTIIDDGYGNGNEQYSGAVITYPNETGYRHNVVGKIKNGDQVEIVGTLENEPSYPRIYSDGKWYTYAAPDSENANKEGYYTIEWMRVIVADGANAGNNEYHEVVNDIKKGGEYTYHLDGVVYLNEKNRYNVEFRLKDVGENTFSIVDPEKYSKRVEAGYSISNLTRPEEHEPNVYPQTKTVDGITYTFSGWYYDEACTDPVNWETDTITQNTVFYARYTPQGQNITVTKDVTGGLGDVQKEFKFTYQIKNASGTVLDSGEFTLKDKDVNNSSSYPIQNVPVGSTLIITETNAGGYFTSTKYNGKNIIAPEDKDSEEKNLEIPIVNGKGDIVITNNKEPIPDTGVHLTSLPYIMTLSFVLAGTAVITVNKYRRRDS